MWPLVEASIFLMDICVRSLTPLLVLGLPPSASCGTAVLNIDPSMCVPLLLTSATVNSRENNLILYFEKESDPNDTKEHDLKDV